MPELTPEPWEVQRSFVLGLPDWRVHRGSVLVALKDPDNRRLQNELGWHNDRGNLLRFLSEPSIEPTNNRAERALRPAVIARKVSQCSKNPQGANAFSAFTSIIRTLARHGDQALVERLCHIFTRPPVNLVPL